MKEFWCDRIPRYLVGGIMVLAALLKFGHPGSFLREVGAYPFLPEGAVCLARMLPPLELFIGTGLLVNRWTGACWLGTILLMGLFTPALVYAWSTDLYLTCSCFGDAFRMPLPWAILRNAIILAVALGRYSAGVPKKARR